MSNGSRTVTQKASILQHLQNYGKITPLEALNLYGCFRLADRILHLRKEGHIITTQLIRLDGKRFAEYQLEEIAK